MATVDRHNFAEWATSFVKHVKKKTEGGRKVVLTYDGRRSHLSARALEILKEGNVIAYCLPSHSSGKTQPLDVGLSSRSRVLSRATSKKLRNCTTCGSVTCSICCTLSAVHKKVLH